MTTQQPQSSIRPPSDWDVHHSRGLLRYDDTQKGNLVLLADVVRWLMKSRVLPRAEAVKLVCAALEGKRPPLLYHVDETELAKPCNDLGPFFRFAPEYEELESLPPKRAIATLHARRIRAEWLMNRFDLEQQNTLGESEYGAMKETPFEFDARHPGSCTGALAVTFADAHKYWGWGTVAVLGKLDETNVDNYKAWVIYRKQSNKLPYHKRKWGDWELPYLLEAKDVFGSLSKLAKELGMSPQRLGEYVRRANRAKAMADAKAKADAAKAEAAPQNPNDILRTLSNSGITATVYHDGKKVKKNSPASPWDRMGKRQA